ncbi:hypothetical protein V8G54_014795 [Vigna mungo]|uniref:Uncharacterized protein n=1 Tax=Vigna mungo TaxID=3915 RepID=A0AAQ3NIA9_VIGMU
MRQFVKHALSKWQMWPLKLGNQIAPELNQNLKLVISLPVGIKLKAKRPLVHVVGPMTATLIISRTKGFCWQSAMVYRFLRCHLNIPILNAATGYKSLKRFEPVCTMKFGNGQTYFLMIFPCPLSLYDASKGVLFCVLFYIGKQPIKLYFAMMLLTCLSDHFTSGNMSMDYKHIYKVKSL